jgi:hypothetical protein
VSDGWCCGYEGGCLVVLQQKRWNVPFQYVERVECPTVFESFFCRAVLDSTGVHIQIATWLAQLLACFSEAFQHCGSCHGGMAEVAGSACQAV